jgi:enediyne polyketide synthase
MERAYHRAGWGVETAEYFEGHGTGTSVGDATELRTLSQARREAGAAAPAAIGSIKANIGHTKAAAGVAGLIKAVCALQNQILPPTTGSAEVHPELAGEFAALRTLRTAEPWPAAGHLRAGVSAMGFGGINAHLALTGVAEKRVSQLSARSREIASSAQDCELFLFAGRDWDDLQHQVEAVAAVAPRLSLSELTDMAAYLAGSLCSGEMRAAIVASNTAELVTALESLAENVRDRGTEPVNMHKGFLFGRAAGVPLIGFAFPGQGTPFNLDGGIFRRRFAQVRELYDQGVLPTTGDQRSTDVAQPGIVGLSVAALRLLRAMNIEATVAIGHSLGELTALHWAGALDEQALLRVAAARGQLMAKLALPDGAMASLEAASAEVAALLIDSTVVIAAVNGPRQTVVSGKREAVAAVVESARVHGIRAVPLPVSCAFHSPLMDPVTPALRSCLRGESINAIQHSVASTVTGSVLAPQSDLEQLLCDQVT